MSRRTGQDAVVVGAGVVGAAAALGLARQGLRVAILEAHAPPAWSADSPDLKVYALAPDARALLEQVGVWPQVRARRAHAYRRMRVWDAAGGGELRFDADALGRSELGHIVEHGLLVDRLWRAVERESGIERLCPARLRGLSQDADGVRVEHDQGSLRARLLVGADGASSRVRDLAGIGSRDHDYGQRALVAYVRTQLPHQDTAWQRFLPGGPLAFLPCAEGRSSIVWTLPEAQAQRLLEMDEAAFRRELEAAFAGTLGALTRVSRRAAFPLRMQLAQSLASNRVAVIGDAAHAVHPLAGQGVNLGLRDVATLRRTLADAHSRGVDPAARLPRWARAQRSANALSAHAVDGINRLFSNDSVVATLLRGPLLGLAGKLPPLTHAFWRHAAGQ